MLDELERLQKEVVISISQASTEQDISEIRVRFLGRKGSLTQLLKRLVTLPEGDRREIGKRANEVKEDLEKKIEGTLLPIRERERREALEREKIDVTLPGRRILVGRRHPLTQTLDEIIDIFSRLGFEVVEGPEVELDYYNFEALNIPKGHPAREMQATFFISDEVVLRTHTSPVQVRTMEKKRPPVRVICPGAVYRCDSDPTHSPMFHQVEGLLVDKGITFADLKGVLTVFVRQMFGKETRLRFRPSFFPFTEPSAEIDIECFICGGKGCGVCSNTGWLEILGSGMVDPAVYKFVNYDPEEVTGFAFGMGIERIAMLKFGINDIRLFFTNDLRFLKQF
ncbi:MAG: phenylalanine--tRNA ligase subunit alpha [Deltaproteobacteria bacterium CG_4_8_14_3_um_filter_45_9]|nr:MAG: phenylalanine--tRNA ligase subunit alpha [Deltaproteobacteria bacterium CG03_land_8_20_14_0_80_45_14]PIX21181.1 MAG: phenylalanine--tRNA ligase subunit alpha [Deltaproteobacteria bacterium CG_4_8_14_3_um_filter_45_9]